MGGVAAGGIPPGCLRLCATPLPNRQPPNRQPPGRGLTRITLDADGRVHAVAYLGRVGASATRLASLVGLHVNFLGQVGRPLCRAQAKAQAA
jgi:hypothetical protein